MLINTVTTRRNVSLVARYSLKFTRYPLLVEKSLVTRCKICSLLVADVARCKKSLVTCCRSCSLQNITCYFLQKLLVTKNQLLLVAKFARCLLQKITRYLLQKLHVAKYHLLLVAEVALCKKWLVTRCRSCSLQKITR